MTGLELFIWYAMPGGTLAVALYVVDPQFWGNQRIPEGLWLAGLPLLGYCLHQLFRIVFEKRGGWENPRLRPSLAALQKQLDIPQESHSPCSAFLVWEVTFYSDCFPESFRQRDIRTWHYLISFWTVAFSCAVGMIILLPGLLVSDNWKTNALWIVVLGVVGSVFFLKGKLTHTSLMELESAVMTRHEEAFKKTKDKLCPSDKEKA